MVERVEQRRFEQCEVKADLLGEVDSIEQWQERKMLVQIGQGEVKTDLLDEVD